MILFQITRRLGGDRSPERATGLPRLSIAGIANSSATTTTTTTTTTGTSAQNIDTFDVATYRSAHYFYSAKDNNANVYQTGKMCVIFDAQILI